MHEIFVEPFSLSTPPARKMIVLIMTLYTLLACNYQMIPFLFYRPKFYCDSPNGLEECAQVDACMQQPLKYQSDYSFSSIPQEFNLYCGDKQHEATMLTFHISGHLIGAILSTFLSDLGHYRHKTLAVLITASLVSGVSCIIGGLAQTPFLLGVCITFWSISCEMILNFLNMIPTLFFPTAMVRKIFSLMVASWSIYPMIMPAIISIHLSWRVIMIWNLGACFLIWGLYVIYHFKELTTFQVKENSLTESLQEIKSITPNTEGCDPHALPAAGKEEISVSFRDMYKSPHFRNIGLYFVVFAGSYVASITSILTLGSIRGNIYINLTLLNLVQISLCFLGGYIVHAFSIRESIKIIYLLLAISYSLYNFVPELLRFFIVIEGKLLTDITWIMLSAYIVIVSPTKYIPLITTARGITNITACVVMPYIKYFMELVRLNIFVFSGAYEFISYIAVRSVKEQDITKD